MSSLQGSAACAASGRASAPARAAAATLQRITLMASPCEASLRSVRHAKPLVHDGARGCVLQELLLLRIQMMLDGEGRERRLVKSGQDELLLARVGVDVADGEHAEETRLELLGIHRERALLECQTPLSDRTELWMQPEEHQQLLGLERGSRAVAALDVDAAQCAVADDERVRQRFEAAHASGGNELLHLRH